MIYPRAAVIGIGLIGGSFALAAKRAGAVGHVVGVARSQATRQGALEVGAADEVTGDAAEAAANADLVYVATPVGAMPGIFQQISPTLSPNVLVTDAGSTKAEVVAAARDLLPPEVTFIGGHPLAGSEQTGPRAARADLFAGHNYFLTPDEQDNTDDLNDLIELVKALGAQPVLTSPQRHDQIVAATSHLPHVVAAALANAVGETVGDEEKVEDFVGTGFVDTTRLAAGSPQLWRDIFITNREYVGRTVSALSEQLQRWGEALSKSDAEQIEELLEEARRWREKLR